MVMSKTLSRITFVVLTALLVGGLPNFMAQEAHAAVTTVTFTNIANDNRMSGDGTVVYTLTSNLGNENAVAGTITFVRTGGTADATTHTYTMTVAGENDLAATLAGNAITKSVTELQADAGFADLVSGTIYTVTVEITNPVLAAVAKTGVTFDNVKPTMVSASTTSSTTIEVTFSEDILDAEAGDFTLDSGLTVASITENNGLVTIITNEVMGEDVTPTITLGADFVTDFTVNVGSENIAIAGNVVATDGVANAAVVSNGSGCDNCEAPTLGIDDNGKRLVDNGFSYNENPIDVERFFTPYPLVTVSVGKQNVAEFKIYDDKGPDSISHFELAFGLASGDYIGDSKAVINWDKTFDGIETITLDDPENVLDDVSVFTFEGYCSDDSQQECLMIKILHTFRAPLDFNILGTNVWDTKRNAWQNYYNHGIEIEGDSLNPPKEYDGISKGHIYHLIETGKTTAVDEFGDTWSFQYGKWMKDYVQNERVQDTSSVFNRVHSNFVDYKEIQVNEAIERLLEICSTCLTSYADFNDSFNYEILEPVDRLEILSSLMTQEERKAIKILDEAQVTMTYPKAEIDRDDRPLPIILAEERHMKKILTDERARLKQSIVQ